MAIGITIALIVLGITLAVAWAGSHAYKKRWRQEMREKYHSDGYTRVPNAL
jgi:hypothetical protein